ncbi:toxin-antitoxin system YwqK family antitoxin [Aureivirga marina]|uniref:toxin-antitoxin system YwqK family antitoxin n=1 Tax=Aureivirga marina TaxID=1182451 RepID=UPI0018C94F9E|nr:hypothetical protein [Aureivirga marina]
MKKEEILAVFGMLFLLISCENKEVSKIEVIKLDKELLEEIKRESDTFFNIKKEEIKYINKKENLETRIFKDAHDNILRIIQEKDGKAIYVREYFENGQVMGELPQKINDKYHGKATYYYKDGRIRVEGSFKFGKSIGIWKKYGKNGNLILIEDYGDGDMEPKRIQID